MRVVILGAGGLCRVMLDALPKRSGYRLAGVLDDHATGRFGELPILGKMSLLPALRRRNIQGVALAVGDRFLPARLELIEAIRSSGLRAINVIHPTAWVSPSARLGEGIYIGPHAVIHAGAHISDFCSIWTGSIIEHDNRIGENVFIAPAVSTAGYAEVDRDAFIGMGAVVLRVKIGSLATVAAGSVVVKDVPSRTLVMGSPAQHVRRKRGMAYHG